MKIIITAIMFTIISLNAEMRDLGCEALMKDYRIDPEVRSVMTWKRAVNNNALQEHTLVLIHVDDKERLGKCLVKNGFDIKIYSRKTGGQ